MLRLIQRNMHVRAVIVVTTVLAVGAFLGSLYSTRTLTFDYLFIAKRAQPQRVFEEHPYFALPKRESNSTLVPDWSAVYQGAYNCSWGSSAILELFIAVFSTAANWEKRAAIRETWAADNRVWKADESQVLVRFFVGQQHDASVTRLVKQEAESFGDLVLVNDTLDGYMQLNKKVLRGFQFVEHCVSSAERVLQRQRPLFVVKTDDDCYVNVAKLLGRTTYLQSFAQPTIFGSLQQHAPVLRSPKDKWYVPLETYPEKYYPDYVAGPLYVASLDVVRSLVELALQYDSSKQLLSWEDIFFTGILPQRAVPPIHRQQLDGVNYARAEPLDVCHYRKNVINSHYVTPAMLRSLWNTSVAC